MDNKHYNLAAVLYSRYISNKSNTKLIRQAAEEINSVISLCPTCKKSIDLRDRIQYELKKL
jgi:hypothetical protein